MSYELYWNDTFGNEVRSPDWDEMNPINVFFLQFEKHKRLPVSTEFTLEGLYPNSLYYIWLAARSKRGEGATTPPIAVRTEQYGEQKEVRFLLLLRWLAS